MRLDQRAITQLLTQARDAGASAIHLKVPGRACLRVEGNLVPVAQDRLMPVDTKNALHTLMALANTEFPLATLQEHEFGLGISGVGRFRVCAYMQRGSIGLVIHRITTQVAGLAELGLTPTWGALGTGLTLVGGRRRPELLAAVVDHLNSTIRGHIVVLEDGVQFLHTDRMASISQREVGIDTDSWESGVRSALRHSADVVVISESSNPSIASLALDAAERGIDVIAGVPGTTPRGCVDVFVRMFGETRVIEIDQRVASVLGGAMTLGEDGARHLYDQELEKATGS